MNEIQGQSIIKERRDKAVCINLLHDIAIDVIFLSSVLVLFLIKACADSSLTNLSFRKWLLDDYCEILLKTGHMIEWTLQKIV